MTNDVFKKMNIQVEGWRSVSHSYALVNQFQLLHWHKTGHASICHVDMPFIMPHWALGDNSAGFHDDDREVIEKISENIDFDVIYRIFAPFGLDTPVNLPTVTFAVTEFGLSDSNYDQSSVDSYAARGGKIHTPSKWSRNRLVASGIPESIIHVIPHGADENYFFQMESATVKSNREILGYKEEDVVLLNVGTHHWNKGLDILIEAFAVARKTNKNLKLLLKDQRSTYLMDSESYVQKILNDKGMNHTEIIDSIRLISGHLNLAQLNALYNVADAYVTPYRAEGFNLPALEAQTCGTPVVATLGGATDDFLSGENYTPIYGNFHQNQNLKNDMKINAYIEPDQDCLVGIFVKLERKKFSRITAGNFSWSNATDSLCKLLA